MERKLKIILDIGALSQDGFNAPQINYDKCIKCGKCSNFCPKKALVIFLPIK